MVLSDVEGHQQIPDGWRTTSLPLHVITSEVGTQVITEFTGYAIITQETAQAHDLEVQSQTLLVSDPRGPITDEAAVDIRKALTPLGTALYIEHGERRSSVDTGITAMWIALGLVALMGAIIGTALHLSETRTDSATLAAVGATSRFRRWVGAWHALTLTGAGAVLAVPLGIAIGLITGHNSTNGDRQMLTPELADQLAWWSGVHWLPFVVAGAICLLATCVGALLVPRHPQLTRRVV